MSDTHDEWRALNIEFAPPEAAVPPAFRIESIPVWSFATKPGSLTWKAPPLYDYPSLELDVSLAELCARVAEWERRLAETVFVPARLLGRVPRFTIKGPPIE